MQAYRQLSGSSSLEQLTYENAPRVSPSMSSPTEASQVKPTSLLSKRPQERVTTDQLCKSKPPSRIDKALQSIALIQASGIALDAQQQRAIMEDALQKNARHRVLQKSYSERKQKSMADNELEVQRLRNAVEELQQHVKTIVSGIPSKLNHAAIAKRYEHHFRCFVSDPVGYKSPAMGFLMCLMSPDAASDPTYGVDAILEDWRKKSMYFDDLRLELSDLSHLVADVLVSSTTTNITITENTLRYAFPRLNSDGMSGLQGGGRSQLALKLRGKQLVMQGSIHFYLDGASNRVVRIQSQADMLSPILPVLGGLKSVCEAFGQALITPELGSVG